MSPSLQSCGRRPIFIYFIFSSSSSSKRGPCVNLNCRTRAKIGRFRTEISFNERTLPCQVADVGQFLFILYFLHLLARSEVLVSICIAERERRLADFELKSRSMKEPFPAKMRT